MKPPGSTPDLALQGPSPALAQRYRDVRAQTEALAAPLSEADCQAQSMADASPAKWHLAHVTWFFETFVLERFEPGFTPHHAAYRVLFNSYYQGVGEQYPRPQRGLLTRPTLAEVLAWRAAVDARVLALLEGEFPPAAAALLELGLQHEQQHQELLLTDVLHLFSCNPLAPAYAGAILKREGTLPALMKWVPVEGGVVETGHHGKGFAFDNEGPRHSSFLRPFALAGRLTTQGEWAEFISDGGYTQSRWWLSAGWDWVRAQRIDAPLYWRDEGVFTLRGLQPLDPHAPVSHISLYEADAYANWRATQDRAPLRLPTETEWEHAVEPIAAQAIAQGNFADTQALQALPAARMAGGLQQTFGDLWEWTRSSYLPYPGFRAAEGAVGEYNGKFMLDQTVLRGGSCATPRDHIRASYRNFFPAHARWQFTGLRLARDMDEA